LLGTRWLPNALLAFFPAPHWLLQAFWKRHEQPVLCGKACDAIKFLKFMQALHCAPTKKPPEGGFDSADMPANRRDLTAA
jgi:hypothetical protein